ncbi:MAG: hypothetical protein WCG92_20385 [Hyphomicrobiales bacterium]
MHPPPFCAEALQHQTDNRPLISPVAATKNFSAAKKFDRIRAPDTSVCSASKNSHVRMQPTTLIARRAITNCFQSKTIFHRDALARMNAILAIRRGEFPPRGALIVPV